MSKNIPVEDLNTGPDTTENLEEVYESRFMSYRHLKDFMSAHPGIQVIDRIEAGNLVKIIYKKPTEMESEKFKYIPDPNNPRRYCRVTMKDQDGNPQDVGVRIQPVDGESLRKLVKEARERGCTYAGTPESDEKIRRAATGFTAERQTDFPVAGDWKEWRKEHADVLGKMSEEDIRDSGDVMFGVDLETQGLQGNVDPLMSREFLERYREPIVLGPNPVITPGSDVDDEPYPTTEEMKKYIDEQCNKNVSQDEDKKDPGDYYRYSNILKRMDDTHTRKNNDYGDAAYQGYKKFGDYYFMVQLHNKYQRLESLTIGNKTQQVKEESIDDTLLDMANYAVMYLESRHRND